MNILCRVQIQSVLRITASVIATLKLLPITCWKARYRCSSRTYTTFTHAVLWLSVEWRICRTFEHIVKYDTVISGLKWPLRSFIITSCCNIGRDYDRMNHRHAKHFHWPYSPNETYEDGTVVWHQDRHDTNTEDLLNQFCDKVVSKVHN